MILSIQHRGKPVQIPNDVLSKADLTVGALRETIANVIGSEGDKTKLLTSGKMLHATDNELPISTIVPTANQDKPVSIIVLATSTKSIAQIATSRQTYEKSTHRLHNDLPSTSSSAPKFIGKPNKTKSSTISNDNEYGFGTIESLKEYSDSNKAQKVLERLGTDAGILMVMREKKWKVGALKEMKPVGKVSQDVCVMGYNVGKGMEIRLRLRTDDESGFRSIPQLLHVLSHELAHNVESEHGIAFKETMRWIERKIKGVDWRGTGGRELSQGINVGAVGSNSLANSNDDVVDVEERSGALGGRRLHTSRLLQEDDDRRRESRRSADHDKQGK